MFSPICSENQSARLGPKSSRHCASIGESAAFILISAPGLGIAGGIGVRDLRTVFVPTIARRVPARDAPGRRAAPGWPTRVTGRGFGCWRVLARIRVDQDQTRIARHRGSRGWRIVAHSPRPRIRPPLRLLRALGAGMKLRVPRIPVCRPDIVPFRTVLAPTRWPAPRIVGLHWCWRRVATISPICSVDLARNHGRTGRDRFRPPALDGKRLPGPSWFLVPRARHAALGCAETRSLAPCLRARKSRVHPPAPARVVFVGRRLICRQNAPSQRAFGEDRVLRFLRLEPARGRTCGREGADRG